MSRQKKFGAFDGVFTPSILTILGVIMYLRMGWVVGNAGLWGSILIVVIANVISVCTGLSISSVATDRKVGIGGVYYMLSRSLGLPIGGAIGLTLFVGTAMSIALYLVGFAESFNAYLGISTDTNGYRMTGSLSLLVLTILAFISTSIAIKTQFIILTAIALSLVSIFIGQGSSEVVNAVPPFGREGTVPLEAVFAVFFPAVTGFTAGIAMSGDLKDPKKDIPIGTILAIAVGFFVYVGLAIFLGLTVDQDLLLTDYNILSKIAYFGPAVIAGIWGATLSSAIGGILGAPRILQAMSIDRISPRLFAKGAGRNKEPRNALILTVLISEAGILIGELDLIARIVSMFYLAAYGFINISFFLESWASSDFKPTFKVSRWVGLIGFIATFTVMFKLDMVAMVAAFILIGGIFLWLQRKQISLGTGDVWQSVWSTIVKPGLKRMEVVEDHKRNWKPNIMLFSGDASARPHLVEFAKSIAGQVGIVTNFDLIENKKAETLFPKHKQNVSDELLQKYGIFGRRIEVNNLYKGIEMLATTFGFSGLDPNTILMGWAKNTKNPVWFAQMTEKLIKLDYNVLYLDYDKRVGFQNREMIDMWWRGISNNAELMLHLARFISSSPEWRNARIRVLLVNDFNVDRRIIENSIQLLLDEFRVDAEIKVINNSVELKPFYELMKMISAKADLIFIGIPKIKPGEEADFVRRTNDLVNIIATTLLVKASSTFETTQLGLKNLERKQDYEPDQSEQLVSLELPQKEELAGLVQNLDQQLSEAASDFSNHTLAIIQQHYQQWVAELEQYIVNLLEKLEQQPNKFHDLRYQSLIEISGSSHEFRAEEIGLLEKVLDQGISDYEKRRTNIIAGMPARVAIPNQNKNGKTQKIPLRKALTIFHSVEGRERLLESLRSMGLANAFLLNFSAKTIREIFQQLALNDAKGEEKDTFIPDLRKQLRPKFQQLRRQLDNLLEKPTVELRNNDRNICNRLVENQSLKAINRIMTREKRRVRRSTLRSIAEDIENFSSYWAKNQGLFHRQFETDVQLTHASCWLHQHKEQSMDKLWDGYASKILDELEKLQLAVEAAKKDLKKGTVKDLNTGQLYQEEADLDNTPSVLWRFMEAMKQLSYPLPAEVEVMAPDSWEDFRQDQGPGIQVINLSISDIANYLVDTHFITPFQDQLTQLRKQLNSISGSLYNHGNLLNYGLDVARKEKDFDEVSAILEKSEHDLEELIENAQSVFDGFKAEMKERFEATDAVLQITRIAEQAETLSQYIRKRGRRNGLRNWGKAFNKRYRDWSRGISLFIARKREDVSAVVFDTPSTELHSDRDSLQEFSESVSPDYAVETQLPFYYRQLFSGKHLNLGRTAYSRRKEMEEVNKAIRFLNEGMTGGVMITGEPLVGKSFFMEYAASRIGGRNVLRIVPPLGGSSAPRALQKAFEEASGKRGSITSILQKMPPKSCILMEDIELWWLKQSDGDRALKQLIETVQQFSSRHYFFFTAGQDTLKHLQEYTSIDRAIVSNILLSPLSRINLNKVLLNRHKTGGVQMTINGKPENKLGEKDWQRLTNRFHKSSEGNVGLALWQWQSQISVDKYGVLNLDGNIAPIDFPELEEAFWYFVLMQLYLHKALSRSRFTLLFQSEGKVWVEDRIDELQKARLLVRHNREILELKPVIRYYLGHVLKERGIL